jgi:hypothetical protein
MATENRAWRYKDTAYLVLGVLLLIGGVLGITAETVAGSPAYFVWGLVLCGGAGVAPGLVLLVLGWKARIEEKQLVEFSSWVRTYRRIPMNDLAKNLGKTRFETEKILAKTVDRGLAHGVIDRSTDEFVLQESIGQSIFVENCPRCGAHIGRWFFPEERFVCQYCNQVILASSSAVRIPPDKGEDATLK